MEEKRNALRQAVKLLEQQIQKIESDNLRLKKGFPILLISVVLRFSFFFPLFFNLLYLNVDSSQHQSDEIEFLMGVFGAWG